MIRLVNEQTTYCDNLRQHCETVGRTVHIVNLGELTERHSLPSWPAPPKPSLLSSHVLCICMSKSLCMERFSIQLEHIAADPAAETFHYPVAFDIRDLVSVEDVMEELKLGPNGCVSYLCICSTCCCHSSANASE